ncbi:hypothetical protein M501DRAFT_995937 [Patellaria atrata CBS 101060]|uniref:Mitochondrial intermembrane space import and assembly protein 40 n=1 Tax=Patellaria atrata CBS 101060 TaxID=1346257 RepID=A0A9P4S7N2_9PEZI|nr:hypothetical protein M501DRAFT_995937 [Patellaria atrata CBS 101060]
MFRIASKNGLRAAAAPSTTRFAARATPRRYLTSASPVDKSRSWKSSVLRWGLAVGAVYWYNTTNVFAEEPAYIHRVPETEAEVQQLPTVDAIAAQRHERIAKQSKSTPTSPDSTNSERSALAEPSLETTHEPSNPESGSPEALEEEAGQQGAFNPETGEINWDCPCLGGMANGPCGEEFKTAFSCFVFSTEDPKGMDCIDKFKGMQECFRQYPDIYGAELDDDDSEGEDEFDVTGHPEGGQPEEVTASSSQPATSARDSAEKHVSDVNNEHTEDSALADVPAQNVRARHHEMPVADSVVPKKSYDASDAAPSSKSDH